MAERHVQVFSKHCCGLPSLRHSSSPETSLRPLLDELLTFYECSVTALDKLVVDLSENNFTLEHLQYFAIWLEEKQLHLYALDLSLNRIYSDTWEDILPSINTLLGQVELLHLEETTSLHCRTSLFYKLSRKIKLPFLHLTTVFPAMSGSKAGSRMLSCLVKKLTGKESTRKRLTRRS